MFKESIRNFIRSASSGAKRPIATVLRCVLLLYLFVVSLFGTKMGFGIKDITYTVVIVSLLGIIITLGLEYEEFRIRTKLINSNIRLSELARREGMYKHALLSCAVSYMEINVTQDLVISEIYVRGENGLEKVPEMFGLKGPIKATLITKYWRQYCVTSNQEEYDRVFSYDNLIECYKRGELAPSIVYNCIPYRFDFTATVEHKCYLGIDELSGDLLALVVLRDITEETRKQEQLEEARIKAEVANKAKSRFLFNMSHDIRTPMNAILGYSEFAKKSADDSEKVRNYLDKVITSGNQLLSLINDILDMSKIESGKAQLDEAPVNLQDVMNEFVDMIRVDAEKKNIEISAYYDIRHQAVYLDKIWFNRILLNIGSNAVKYSKEGGCVAVRVVEQDTPESSDSWEYRIEVSDKGIGMSKEYLRTIFDEFTRERTSTVSGIQGTGLGMAIVKRIIELMGGTINIESEENVGTDVTINVHFRKCFREVSRIRKIVKRDVDLSGRCILIAEDNDMNAEIAETILTDNKVKVERAVNGKQAVEMVDAAPPGYYDAVLMDIQMPVMDGYEATEMIRKLPDSVKADVPVIAMTANAFAEDKKRALEKGMNAHIGKPINVSELIYTIHDQTFHVNCRRLREFKERCINLGKRCGYFVYAYTDDMKLLYADSEVIAMCGCKDYDEFMEHTYESFDRMIAADDLKRVLDEIDEQIKAYDGNIDDISFSIDCRNGMKREVAMAGYYYVDREGKAVVCAYVADMMVLPS